MNEYTTKTSAWISTDLMRGTALLRIYNYDSVGRVHCVTTLPITRRSLQQLIHRIDLHEDEHDQDPLPF